MSSTIRVLPVAGVQVRDPETGKHVPPEGLAVELSQFWLRRLDRGDVVAAPGETIVDPAAEPAPSPARKSAKTE